MPSPMESLSAPRRDEVASLSANGPTCGSPNLPTTLLSPFSNAWYGGTLSQVFPASPDASSYTTSTPACTSSSLIPEGPTNASATPWTHASRAPVENAQGGYSPGSSSRLSAAIQDRAFDDALLLTAVPNAVVSSPASRDASEKRRKAERRFPCLVQGCGYASTRKENLKGE